MMRCVMFALDCRKTCPIWAHSFNVSPNCAGRVLATLPTARLHRPRPSLLLAMEVPSIRRSFLKCVDKCSTKYLFKELA